MKQTQRHNGIIELVKQQGYVSTEELVEHFSVSPQTIRRDLNELAEQNLILRHHGGAALPSSSVNTPWHDRKATQTEEKERIARKVAEQIPNGSTLFIDIGTTPEAVAHALLNHSNLRIVTNNLNVANTCCSTAAIRSRPIPVSTDGFGSGSIVPSAWRLNCMKTMFQISM